MAAYSQSYYRALLVPDWRIDGATPWAAQSSYTQAGAHPGTPTDSNATSPAMTLEASGEYVSTTSPNLVINTAKPGHATRTGAGAHFVWESQAGTKYGWDRPGTVNGQDLIGSESANYGRSPHIVTVPSTGAVICAYHVIQASTAPPGTIAVYTRTRAAATGTWATAVGVRSGSTDFSSATGTNISALAGPCLLVLPSERVLCFVPVEDVTSNKLAIWMYYSDDEGATWLAGSVTCLPAAIDTSTYTVRKIRAGYLDGQILLLVHRLTTAGSSADVTLQYASDDLGGSFRAVGGNAPVGLPEVLTVGNRFVIAYAPTGGETNAYAPCWSVLGSAWSPLDEEYTTTSGTLISGSAATSSVSGNITGGNLTLCQDERGILFAFWGAADLFGAMQDGTLSGDTGTWEPLGATGWSGIVDLASGDVVRESTATFQRGRVLLAAANTSGTAATDAYLCVWYLGGYTTVELPAFDVVIPWYLTSTGNFVNIPMTWCPIELPQNTGWTAAGTASVETLTASGADWYLHVETSANQRYYELPSITASAAGGIALAVCRSNNTTNLRLVYRASGGGGGADDYTLVIDLTNTTITMMDGALTVLQTDSHGAGSAFLEILFAVNSGLASVWYRTHDTNTPRAWTLLGDAEAIVVQSTGTTNYVSFGSVATNANYNYDVKFFGHTSGAVTGQHLAGGAGPLHGRPLSGSPVYVDNGVWVRAAGGPAIGIGGSTGDAWDITPRYDYAVANLDPRIASSPRDKWRSTQGTADEYVAYELDPDGDARMPTDMLGVHLEGINHPKWLLQTHDGSSWTTRLTLTAYALVAWTREAGSVIISYTSGGYTGVLREDELVGGAMMFGTASAADIRRITRNTGGTVQSSGSPLLPRLYCSDIDDGEGASGTGYVWFPRVSGVVPLSSTGYVKGVRLYADVDTTFLGPPEGYFECGSAAIGSVYLLGFNPDLGRARVRQPMVDVEESRDGRKRSRVRGPSRRRLSLSWEGVPTGELHGLADRHVVSDGSGTPVVALRHQVPYLLDGLLDHLDGGHTPIVYLPNVAATGAQVMLQGALYGRIDGEIGLQTIGGQGRNEDDDETIAVTLDLVEEV